MAKFYGNIGFAETVETEPGVWVEEMTVRPYYGELVRNIRRLENSGGVNDNVNISNDISIIADPYAQFVILSLWVPNGKFRILKFSTQD